MTPKALSLDPLRPAVPLPRAARVLFAVLSRLRFGHLEIAAPGGHSFAFPGAMPGPDAALTLDDWDVCGEILRKGDIGFAEAYLEGRWSTPDLGALLTLAALNHGALDDAIYGSVWGKLLYRVRHLLRANTRAGSRRNIHAHYDLGNDFYAQWLDSTMTYSSALFAGDLGQSLEAAQLAKYERILAVVDPRPGQRILEIGCGWGAFAEYAARTRRCSVHGITVSQRQLQFAQSRIERVGLAEQVSLAFCDYRDVQGRYDHVVSIEMIEAVGERYWPAYFDAIAARLAPGGRAVLQAITIADALFERYRRGTDFIQQYVFPGGMLASTGALSTQAARAGLAVRGRHGFGADYAETLHRWSQRFNAAWPQLRGGGFDTRFRRLWNFYLAYCEAGFRAGTTDVMHVEMTHA
jgi:cyclopropane-fatty-acyl-phospholipid synthase